MVKAVSDGHKTFKGLAVSTDVPSAISPCGICRQFLREFCSLSMPILMVPGPNLEPGGKQGQVVETTMGEILPLSFGPEDLEKRPRMAGE